MLLARRKFVQSSLLFSATTFLFWENAKSGFAQSLLRDDKLSDAVLRDPIFRFTRETFEPYVGGYFESPGARGKMVTLKLVSIDTNKTKTGLATDSFTLHFDADGELPLFISIYPIKHAALGSFDLFLTRRDGPNGDISYEAVFNHLK
jgi:hypothetical protein